LSETTVLAAPPAVVRTLLTRRFASYAEGRTPPTLFQRIAAVLTFDSGRSPAAAGARGVGTTELPRQLIFTADLADIAINVQPRRHDSSLDISGQILPNGGLQVDSWSVQVLHDATELGLTTTDELGEWRIEQLPPGTYELILSAAELELVIPAVPLFP
jgi:hypothetical protein